MGLSLSAESIQKRPSIKRSNSRDKRHYLHRSTSRRNKENGSRSSRYCIDLFKMKLFCYAIFLNYYLFYTAGLLVLRDVPKEKIPIHVPAVSRLNTKTYPDRAASRPRQSCALVLCPMRNKRTTKR